MIIWVCCCRRKVGWGGVPTKGGTGGGTPRTKTTPPKKTKTATTCPNGFREARTKAEKFTCGDRRCLRTGGGGEKRKSPPGENLCKQDFAKKNVNPLREGPKKQTKKGLPKPFWGTKDQTVKPSWTGGGKKKGVKGGKGSSQNDGIWGRKKCVKKRQGKTTNPNHEPTRANVAIINNLKKRKHGLPIKTGGHSLAGRSKDHLSGEKQENKRSKVPTTPPKNLFWPERGANCSDDKARKRSKTRGFPRNEVCPEDPFKCTGTLNPHALVGIKGALGGGQASAKRWEIRC